MKFQYIDPPIPSIARYREFRSRTKGASILRSLQYEALVKLDITGRVLDFGGGQTATYVPLLPVEIELISVNIDRQFKPTNIVDVGEILPFETASFDCAICLNVLEHIYDAKFVIDEIYRVLKPGAILHISVPWMFPIHSHPNDYCRYAPDW